MTYELVNDQCNYAFANVEALRKYLRIVYRHPHLTDRTGGYVWSDLEIDEATENCRLVYVWPDREASLERNAPPAGIVRRVRKTVRDNPTSEKSRPQ